MQYQDYKRKVLEESKLPSVTSLAFITEAKRLYPNYYRQMEKEGFCYRPLTGERKEPNDFPKKPR